MFEKVTDPELLKKLNAGENSSSYEKVNDPEILKQLNDENEEKQENQGKNPFFMPKIKSLEKTLPSGLSKDNLEGINPLNLIKSGLIGMGTAGKNIAGLVQDSPKNLNLQEIFHQRKNPGFLENLVEGTAQYAPMAASASFGAPAAIGLGSLYGASQSPENRVSGAILGGATGALPGAIGLAKKYNPLRLTSSNIAKEVLTAEKSAKGTYSGETGKYPELFKEAYQKGYGKFENLKPKNLQIETLSKYTPNANKKLESLVQFSKSPNLENAQKAISELGHITRKLESKTSLPPYEKKQYEAALKSQEEIKKNMFSNKKGIDEELIRKHGEVQKGYKEDVIPYSTNKDIKKFKEGEITAKELVDKLSKKRKISEKHKIIGVKKGVMPALGIGTAGAAGATAYGLIKKLLSKD